MKKADELMLYTPAPKRPPLDARRCISVAEGLGQGRYIKGKTLTVAVWDDCKNPLVVWRFCGDYWTGELRREKNPCRRFLRPDYIDTEHGRSLLRTDVAATQHESELLQNYFDDHRPVDLIRIVDNALSAASRKKREIRDAKQAKETKKMLATLPEIPWDIHKRILACCHDDVFLWITNTKESRVFPGGVKEMVPVQRVRCDSCGGEYSVDGREMKHKKMAACRCCGRTMQIYNTQYSARRVWRARTFLLSQPDNNAVWVRRMVVYFNFENHNANLDICPGDIWWTDGASAKHWKKKYFFKDNQWDSRYIMCQSNDISKGMTASTGYYQPRVYAAWERTFEHDLRKVMKSGWIKKYDKGCNFYREVKFWESCRRYPMAESLIKTGWADALASYLDGSDGGYCNHQHLKIHSKTYYGVFGLTKNELALIHGRKDTFTDVNEAVGWKKAGLQITARNLQMVSALSTYRVQDILKEHGLSRSLKYLRQQTRRITGKYDGVISPRVTSDWIDYLDMAQKAGMNLAIESVLYPLDLKRRHDDLVAERARLARLDHLKDVRRQIEEEAADLESRFSIEQIMQKIKKTYQYDGEKYLIRVPDGAKSILEESRYLDHCIQRGTRYFERIATRESYILFLRKKDDPNTPWYTLEVEPGGTIRQKRSYNNNQFDDLEDAKPFLAEWQLVVQRRMSATEVSLAEKSRAMRDQEFEELRKKGSVIRTGSHAGQLLVDELMRDLMEVEQSAG